MKIALLGYGKMGKIIERLALKQGHEIVLKIGSNNIEDLNPKNLQKAEVAIEFSQPEAAFNNIKMCLENGVAVVSGTTAWLDKMEAAKEICARNKGAFFYASNFSIGVNIFFELNKRLAELMDAYPQYQIGMEEIHHTEKVDAPSGTAITLVNDIIDNVARKSKWVKEVAGDDNEIPIVSKRVDNVPGTHGISYRSEIDSIVMIHTAHSRVGFASGAILAAEWLIGKEGCFGMSDML